MSNKTMKQRIALVAVSALTAGVLSVVAAPVANAANEPATGEFILITRASTTGSGVVPTAGDTDVGRSTGWITKGTASGATTGTTSAVSGTTVGFMMSAAGGADAVTGVINAGAQLGFAARTLNSVSGEGMGFVLSGATISGLTVAQGTSLVNGTRTTAIAAQTGTTANNYIAGLITANAAVGSTVTISVYQGAGITSTSTATNGVLVGTVSLTVAAASASGTYSAADSQIFIQPAIAAGGTSSSTDAFDTTTRLDNGQVGVIRVLTRDAYLGAVTGALTASTSAGTVVVTNSNVAAADSYSGTSTFATQTSFDGDGYIVVKQPTANTASSSVVTITLDGAVIATKTVSWNGIAATVDLVAANSASIFSNGYAPGTGDGIAADGRNANVFYVVKDAAGNALTVSDAATNLSISDQTASLVGASIVQGDVTGTLAAATVTAVLQTKSLGYGVATMNVPSTSLRGAGTYRLAYVNGLGATIKSAVINATVSGSVDTFTASWDKASYQSGDIATLTISAKDSKGNLVADGVVLGANSLITTNTDGLASVTSSCDSANIATTTFSGGKKDCKFAVKNTAGSYAFTAVIPTATSQAATAGTVKVTDSSGAVSNAQVLQSIVALIASINKQIQALQKLILARR